MSSNASPSSVRQALIQAGLDVFNVSGYEAATIDQVRSRAGVSNGSFYHLFPNKRALAAAIYVDILQEYHRCMLAALKPSKSASAGIKSLISEHLDWVAAHRSKAAFLFEQARAELLNDARDDQKTTNDLFRSEIAAWSAPLVQRGELRRMDVGIFVSQIIGPAQLFCRAWLSGRSDIDPRKFKAELIGCAERALKSTSG